ncbi:GPI-anchored protein 52 [Cyberlindnera fabianii]|uniref:glucan endo-1,3-beta-D-glucosidase n=1 Tax=Cyberlindnera fabianii TaxID=36022 RepID=A0A1V2L7Q3_CYBFA|nr:GPI-anchored protein 52 [Cyberlindnera fabianii]
MKYSLLTFALAAVASAQQDQNPNQNSNGASRVASSSSSSSTSARYSEYGVLEFDNLGFEGYYKHVKTLDDSDSCKCELASNKHRTLFSGTNSPLDQELSVHFRGPLSLKSFGYYTSNDSSSDVWSRKAYYDGSSGTSENITFLTAAGQNSTCLGKALTYADSDGISEASSSTVLKEDTLIGSDEEFIIFSNVSCGDSGFDKDCGVYRDGIPAYHGYGGTTKMFLFEFTMPEETAEDDDSYSYYNMPAIWLLNSHIPRTSQYPSNENCSCWATGCGEFDIFEVMNTTEATHLYSTIHDYQGSGDIGTGLVAPGWTKRQYDSTMLGGVVFGTDGTVSVFLSNDTSFDQNISASDVSQWISSATTEDDETSLVLASATNTGSGSVSGASGALPFDLDIRWVFAAFALVGAVGVF